MHQMENFSTLLGLTELTGSKDPKIPGEIVDLISSSQLACLLLAFSLLLVFSVYL